MDPPPTQVEHVRTAGAFERDSQPQVILGMRDKRYITTLHILPHDSARVPAGR